MWAAYHGDVPIQSNARDSVTMIWRPEDAAPGLYRYGFTIADAGTDRQYANLMAADRIVVGG